MVTYPMNLPAQGVKGIVIRKSDVVGMSIGPYDGSQEVVAYPGQWWEADVTFSRATLQQAGAIEGFIGLMRGPLRTFLMGDPMRPVPLGQAASSPGTPVCDGITAKDSGVLPVRGAVANKTGWLLAGDYIQRGTGASTRLHQVLVNADTDADGKTSLLLWPNLRTATTDGEAIVVTGCKGVFRLTQPKQGISRRPGPFTDYAFSAVEAIP